MIKGQEKHFHFILLFTAGCKILKNANACRAQAFFKLFFPLSAAECLPGKVGAW